MTLPRTFSPLTPTAVSVTRPYKRQRLLAPVAPPSLKPDSPNLPLLSTSSPATATAKPLSKPDPVSPVPAPAAPAAPATVARPAAPPSALVASPSVAPVTRAPPRLSFSTPPMASAAPQPSKMDIVSPASPMGLRLSSNVNKAATVFLSHVRRTFARFPVDYTGELVRLLDDIATFTCTTSSAVAERSRVPQYGTAAGGADIDAEHAVQSLYRMLAHDGYCCIIMAKGTEHPLTFEDSVLHGNYVVCVTPLDIDVHSADERGVAGMAFSIYKRKSSTSLPGRGIDLRQSLSDQVAAGYASFSSATSLYYTMGHGVYSFVMHPVALQYFLQPPMRLAIPQNPTTVYADRALLRSAHPAAKPLAKMIDKLACSMFSSGCLIGDVHQLLQTGGVLVATGVELLCEAAPVAFIIEQCGGVATDEYGRRIMDMAITDDVMVQVTLVLGTPESVANLQLPSAPAPENGTNGSADN